MGKTQPRERKSFWEKTREKRNKTKEKTNARKEILLGESQKKKEIKIEMKPQNNFSKLVS